VRLTVRDTGTGMDEATRSHIFEPFFTTKEAGKGTGLGLSTVFGIVQQSGGSIAVESHLGAGATFKLYLPRAAESALTPSVAPVRTPLHRGTETILLAEDDDQLRQLITTILGRKGYVVLAAASPAEALVLAERHGGRPIHLLLTDVVMPGMNGRELAQKLTLAHPEACVLFMSGYTGSVVVDHGVFDHTAAFIQKPMTPDLLLRKLREVLDAPRGSASG